MRKPNIAKLKSDLMKSKRANGRSKSHTELSKYLATVKSDKRDITLFYNR